METFAYLHVAQDYETPEVRELIKLQQSWLLNLSQLLTSRNSTIALLTWLCALPGLTSAASALQIGVYPNADLSTAPVYSSNAATIRPDGDQNVITATATCNIASSPCADDYRPLYPADRSYSDRGYSDRNYSDRSVVRPVYPDPDYRPVRPSRSSGVTRASGLFLRRGDSGTDVRYVQDLLRSAGYLDAATTGFYASLTESGVKEFQRDYGLSVDGIVGTETLAALESRG